ncbi:outer membrane protein assembly factor BamB family protein [Kineobactrum salinum]|uniref:PQQ-binding-like beta-propeller repeat protein n=1 Tax=Kineobactrum salinum TaxID=2708301 RepID=A0A6C0U4R7_9GAMM|nr:PQQ-binding-like beta-propeller repeat protein [Kineobactrum salinum]QIB66843.1 PQQ-binding-like beta-propeller repeat protein [Kineobactrum salinum]
MPGIAAKFLALAGISMLSSAGNVPFTAEQADNGALLYAQHCQTCHGSNLRGGTHAPTLNGGVFRAQWAARSVSDLLNYLSTNMPPRQASTLSLQSHADILAFLLQKNGEQASYPQLPGDFDTLFELRLPPWPNYLSGGGLAPGVTIPAAPAKSNPLHSLSPVTDAMLTQPADGDWLMWRRTYDAYGFSPLDEIDASNVGSVTLAWSWTLPQGPNPSTPVVHDGVLFVYGMGDTVQALDASNGDLLWQYSRRLPSGVTPSHKRSLAIYGTSLFLPTSDGHVIALDAKSGTVIWDQSVGVMDGDLQLISGPIVVKSKVIIGTSGSRAGGNEIIALEAATGQVSWRIPVIQRPFEGGIDTWNAVPLDERNGGSVWLPGSYNAKYDVVLFGTGNTYHTTPLMTKSSSEDVSNDGLYLDSTLALKPETGELVWYFQHFSNDQWDMDWAFERQSIRLPINGVEQDVVITGGKVMIFDLLRAQDGAYLSSISLGMQNLISDIDPVTGKKHINSDLLPVRKQVTTICPHVSGGRGWLPTTYLPEDRVLVVPITEACMDLVPAGENESTVLSTGFRWTVRPRPDSDGLYGRLQAVDLETGETRWLVRERPPFTAGTLATAGSIVFAGSLDRTFKAYDSGTGKMLWSARLNDAPSSPPITYESGGKQYVAVIVGPGGYQSVSYDSLLPELQNPMDSGTVLWVFALPNALAPRAGDTH